MAAYHRVYDSRHLQADCQEPGSAPEPYALRSITGYLYLFLHLANASALPTTCGHINRGNVSRRHDTTEHVLYAMPITLSATSAA